MCVGITPKPHPAARAIVCDAILRGGTGTFFAASALGNPSDFEFSMAAYVNQHDQVDGSDNLARTEAGKAAV